MSAADLGVGLRGCVESGQEWPPSLPAFRAMCKPKKREHESMYRCAAMLEHKLSDEARQKGRAVLAEIRGRLT